MRFTMSYATRVEDLNVGGHLDNLRILRAVDEARNAFLGMPRRGRDPVLPGIFGGFGAGVAPFVVSHRVAYLTELFHDEQQPLDVSLWVCRVGNSSLDIAAEVRARPAATGCPPAAVAVTGVVLMAFETPESTPAPWPISDEARVALTAYQHEPPEFR